MIQQKIIYDRVQSDLRYFIKLLYKKEATIDSLEAVNILHSIEVVNWRLFSGDLITKEDFELNFWQRIPEDYRQNMTIKHVSYIHNV